MTANDKLRRWTIDHYRRERDASRSIHHPLWQMTDADVEHVADIALAVQERCTDKQLPPSEQIVKSPPMPANRMMGTPARERVYFAVDEIVAWRNGPAVLPASTEPGSHDWRTRYFDLGAYIAEVKFDRVQRLRSAGRANGPGSYLVDNEGFGASVTVSNRLTGETLTRRGDDGLPMPIVRNLDPEHGQPPTVAQIEAAGRAIIAESGDEGRDHTGGELRAIRRRLGLTQTKFAERLNAEIPGLGATQQQVARWESGERAPHPATMELARRMGRPADTGED